MKNKKNILIYSAGNNSYGGIEYLKYIIHSYSKERFILFLDSRINANELNTKNYIQYKNNFLLRTNIFFKRINWKLRNKKNLEELFLNGIPPLFRINSSNKIIIMFQNVFLLDPSYDYYLSTVRKLTFIFLRKFINIFLDDTYEILLQTNSMVKHFKKLKNKNNKITVNKNIQNKYLQSIYLKKYNLEKLRSKFNNFRKIESIVNTGKTLYFYPASFDKHKNHKRLIKAFENLPDKIKKNIYLVLTINQRDISEITCEENILTIGKINRNYLNYLFINSNFLIFPSIIESLGIPLLEAKYSNLKIIASNIDVIKEICDPLFTFNPKNINDIALAIINSYKKFYKL